MGPIDLLPDRLAMPGRIPLGPAPAPGAGDGWPRPGDAGAPPVAATVERPTVLIVDDAPGNLRVLGELLLSWYRVRAATCGEAALRIAASDPRPDLILLDVTMPRMDGHEVLRHLREEPATSTIPVIFITARAAAEEEEHGLDLGAVDYIVKPFNPSLVLARVRTQLELKFARDRLAGQNDWLEHEVARRMRENLLIQDLSVRALACLAEARDRETGHHIVRTQRYVALLARHLAGHPRFRAALAGPRLDMVVRAAPLHDIGKVGVPDAILRKPGRLTAQEFEVMKAHPAIGAEAITKAMQQALEEGDATAIELAGGAFAFLDVAREISLGHQEKWDGSGYPGGVAGDAIPVSARLMALADVFDALLAPRVYKSPMTLDEVTRIIVTKRGTHFDPDVVDAFLACREDFAQVAARFAEPVAEDAQAKPYPHAGAAMQASGATTPHHAAETAAVGAAAPPANISGARILLAEDNGFNQEVAVELLRRAGVSADVAANGAEALAMLDRTDAADGYDAVLMDVQMPVMDGLTATREIRRRPRFAGLPVIAMTANAMSDDRAACLAAGMNEHLTKPIDPEQLFATLRAWIRPRRRDGQPLAAAAAPAAAASFGPVAGLDVAAGLRLCLGQVPLYESLLRRFVMGQRDVAAALDAAVAAADWPAAGFVVHTLKGNCGQIGARELHAACERVEHALRQRHDPAALADDCRALGTQLATQVAAIDGALPAAEAGTAMPEAQPAALSAIADELAAELAADDVASCRTIVQYEALLRAAFPGHFAGIAQAIHDFDFAAARTRLDAALSAHRTDRHAAA